MYKIRAATRRREPKSIIYNQFHKDCPVGQFLHKGSPFLKGCWLYAWSGAARRDSRRDVRVVYHTVRYDFRATRQSRIRLHASDM